MNPEYQAFLAAKAPRAQIVRPSSRSKINSDQLSIFENATKMRPKDWHKPFVIYGLIDPETLHIRYIGKTERPMERLIAHWGETSSFCHRSHWMQNLTARGLFPEMVFLQMVEGHGKPEWEFYERYWIAYARAHDWPITNNTSGGDGVRDLPLEARERIRRAGLGKSLTDEHKAKISASRAHYRATDETKAKHSASMKGRKIAWIDKIAARLRKLSVDDQVEIIRRRNAGEKVKDLAMAYNVDRTTISKIFTGRYNTLRQKPNTSTEPHPLGIACGA